MNNTIQKRQGQGLGVFLAFLAFVYIAGVFFSLLCWLGIQGYDPLTWNPKAFPFLTLVCLLGGLSCYEVWRRKKRGVYGLASTWVLTGVINLIFVRSTPIPYAATFWAGLLVLAFFLLLLPVWQKMK